MDDWEIKNFEQSLQIERLALNSDGKSDSDVEKIIDQFILTKNPLNLLKNQTLAIEMMPEQRLVQLQQKMNEMVEEMRCLKAVLPHVCQQVVVPNTAPNS